MILLKTFIQVSAKPKGLSSIRINQTERLFPANEDLNRNPIMDPMIHVQYLPNILLKMNLKVKRAFKISLQSVYEKLDIDSLTIQ